MLGGTEAKDEQDVTVYSRLSMEPVSIGEHVELAECLPPHHPIWRKAVKAGRPCPRVELDLDNIIPYSLVMTSASEHTRPMFGARLEALTRGMSDEMRDAIVERTYAGLTCEALQHKLYPSLDKDKASGS